MKKLIYFLLAGVMFMNITACKQVTNILVDNEDNTTFNDSLELSNNFDQTVAALSSTDDFGRTFKSYKSLDNTKYVGMYYALWLGEHPGEQDGIYNVNELLASPDNAKKLWATEGQPDYDKTIAPQNKYYFWDEPLYGYYKSTDPWVIARHIELITLAGVDFLFLDVSNGFSYARPLTVLLEVLEGFRAQGWKTPKLTFLCNSGSSNVVGQLYEGFYATGLYDDHWFAPNSKPMISVMMNHKPGEDMRAEVESRFPGFFDIRGSVWPNADITEEQKSNGFPWIDWNKFHTDYGGIMNVSVAQHVSLPFSKSVFSEEDYHANNGRGFNSAKNKNFKEDVIKNMNFERQWEAKNKLDPKIITVTGWNEWVALKLPGPLSGMWVDNFNLEFSRDLEMTRGGYKDNAFLQLARNVRNRKGAAGEADGFDRTKLYVNQGIAQWKKGGAVYKDFVGDAVQRNHKDYVNKNTLTDNSNRNDISEVRVAHDLKDIHFLIRTDNQIVEDFESGSFMNILFGIDGSQEKNFSGYQYRINGSITKSGTTSVEKCDGGYNFTKVGDVSYRMGKEFLQVSVPRALLGLTDTATAHQVYFKVTDNITNPSDILDYYISGDSAPIGRLNYHYKMNV